MLYEGSKQGECEVEGQLKPQTQLECEVKSESKL